MRWNRLLLLYGLAIWAAATIVLRLFGQYVLRPNHRAEMLLVFAASFPLMAWLARRLCGLARLAPEQWVEGTASLILPTLVLDTFSSAFFPSAFPNIAPEMAGVFGAWMLWCCAGAVVGAMLRRAIS